MLKPSGSVSARFGPCQRITDCSKENRTRRQSLLPIQYSRERGVCGGTVMTVPRKYSSSSCRVSAKDETSLQYSAICSASQLYGRCQTGTLSGGCSPRTCPIVRFTGSDIDGIVGSPFYVREVSLRSAACLDKTPSIGELGNHDRTRATCFNSLRAGSTPARSSPALRRRSRCGKLAVSSPVVTPLRASRSPNAVPVAFFKRTLAECSPARDVHSAGATRWSVGRTRHPSRAGSITARSSPALRRRPRYDRITASSLPVIPLRASRSPNAVPIAFSNEPLPNASMRVMSTALGRFGGSEGDLDRDGLRGFDSRPLQPGFLAKPDLV